MLCYILYLYEIRPIGAKNEVLTMNTLKRMQCLLLALILLLCTGCGGDKPAQTPAEEEKPAAETEQTATPDPQPEPEKEPESKPEPAPAEKEEPKEDTRTLEEVINDVGEKYGAVGIQTAVVMDGELYGTYNYGWATLDKVAMTDDIRIRAASISKIFVGVAAMIAMEDGYIDLDTDISEYWGEPIINPNHPTVPITIRSLLTHTSSLEDLDFTFSRSYEPVKEKLTTGKAFSKKKPGSTGAYEYNNFAYDVLAMTIEQATGKWVDEILQERFAIMELQGGYKQDGLNADNIATLYRENDIACLTATSQAGYLRGSFPGSDGNNYAGGLTISATDLSKLLIMLACDGVYEGQQLLSPESIEMMENATINTVTGYKQGLAIRLRNGYGRKGLYFHPGDAYGTFSLFAYDPATRDGVVIVTTGGNEAGSYGNRTIYNEIATFAFKELDAVRAAETSPEN